MTVALVIGLLATPASGATGASTPLVPQDRQARESTASPRVAPVHCPVGSKPAGVGCIDKHPVHIVACSARKAVKFYAGRIRFWRDRMGAAVPLGAALEAPTREGRCPRYLAHVLQRKAHSLSRAYERWYFYHYRWDHWLPAKWYRIARCETGVRWDWNSGAYQGAFGFAVSSWDSFRLSGYPSEAYLATPRQQWNVALAIWRRFGFSGWGCRNA